MEEKEEGGLMGDCGKKDSGMVMVRMSEYRAQMGESVKEMKGKRT